MLGDLASQDLGDDDDDDEGGEGGGGDEDDGSDGGGMRGGHGSDRPPHPRPRPRPKASRGGPGGSPRFSRGHARSRAARAAAAALAAREREERQRQEMAALEAILPTASAGGIPAPLQGERKRARKSLPEPYVWHRGPPPAPVGGKGAKGEASLGLVIFFSISCYTCFLDLLLRMF